MKNAFLKTGRISFYNRKSWAHFFSLIQAALLAFILIVCVPEVKADEVKPDLIKNFVEPEVTANKAGLYIIRGANRAYRSRKIWAAVNESVVASMTNGSHVYVELDAGRNTLNFVMQKVGFGYLSIDCKPGEVIYAKIDFGNTYSTEIINKDIGQTMVMETSKVEPLAKKRRNDGYDNLLVNPGTLGYPIMKEFSDDITADENHAVVRFFRPKSKCWICPWLNFDIWNQDGYVGTSKDGHYFVVKLKPGSHTFYTFSGKYRKLGATLAANNEYAVEIDVYDNYSFPNIRLEPVNLSSSSGRVQAKAWRKKLKATCINKEAIESDPASSQIKKSFDFLNNKLENDNVVKEGYLNPKYGKRSKKKR